MLPEFGHSEAWNDVIGLQTGHGKVDQPEREEKHGGDDLDPLGSSELPSYTLPSAEDQDEYSYAGFGAIHRDAEGQAVEDEGHDGVNSYKWTYRDDLTQPVRKNFSRFFQIAKQLFENSIIVSV